MGDETGLILLVLLAASTGYTLTMTPTLGGNVLVVLDPGGLNLTWSGPVDGRDDNDVAVALLETHHLAHTDSKTLAATFKPSPTADGQPSRGKVRALGHVLGALAAASDWHAVAMIAAPVPDGSMLFIGPTKHPVLLGAVARVTGMLIDPRVSVVGGEVADA